MTTSASGAPAGGRGSLSSHYISYRPIRSPGVLTLELSFEGAEP